MIIEIEVDEKNLAEVKKRVEGRTIVKFEREPDSGQEWGHGENSVSIILDDGARLDFVGQGYDSSGLGTGYWKDDKDSEES